MDGIGTAGAPVWLALGTNMGDRRANLALACSLLARTVQVEAVSPLYETEPAYVTDQPRFLNAALRGTTLLSPHALLGALKEIERALGRTTGLRYGPRPIDLDILLYADQQIATPELVVPHPRMHERPFVLVPLADIAADIVPPGWAQSIGALAAQVRGHGDVLAQAGTL